jgi:hypothetical protein
VTQWVLLVLQLPQAGMTSGKNAVADGRLASIGWFYSLFIAHLEERRKK